MTESSGKDPFMKTYRDYEWLFRDYPWTENGLYVTYVRTQRRLP